MYAHLSTYISYEYIQKNNSKEHISVFMCLYIYFFSFFDFHHQVYGGKITFRTIRRMFDIVF